MNLRISRSVRPARHPIKPPPGAIAHIEKRPIVMVQKTRQEQHPPFMRMRQFGKMGRFGNQLFQYAWCRIVAEKNSSKLELPNWVGQQLFGLPEHPISLTPATRTLREKDEHSSRDDIVLGLNCDARNAEVSGYFQYHTSHYAPYKNKWKDYFAPHQEVKNRLYASETRLRDGAGTVIGIHLRRGDYGRRYFYITPTSWYKTWLTENWGRFTNPKLFVATEDQTLVQEFSDWSPQTSASLGTELVAAELSNHTYLDLDRKRKEPHMLDFYPDFYFLSKCDVVLVPNSTYSVAATMIGEPKECWRSSLRSGKFDRYDPWDTQPLQYDMVENFKHLSGVSLTDNPYWH